MPVLHETIHRIPIPAGVTVTVDSNSNHTVVKGPKGQLERPFRSRDVKVRRDGDFLVVEKDLPNRKEKAMAGTYAAHIQNMITGVTTGWTYHMKAVYNHFPIKLTVQGATFLVENFLGERAARSAQILPGVKVTEEIAAIRGIPAASRWLSWRRAKPPPSWSRGVRSIPWWAISPYRAGWFRFRSCRPPALCPI